MKLEVPAVKKLVYTSVFDVKWGDMDAMGHVNNTVYFKYMEHGRIAWLSQIGFLQLPNGQAPVIANTFCNFRRQLKYPDQVVMKLYVSNPQRVTFDAWTTLERVNEPGVLCAEGGATVLWIDAQREKAVSLPDALRVLVSDADAGVGLR